jgi:hypothetical protein
MQDLPGVRQPAVWPVSPDRHRLSSLWCPSNGIAAPPFLSAAASFSRQFWNFPAAPVVVGH